MRVATLPLGPADLDFFDEQGYLYIQNFYDLSTEITPIQKDIFRLISMIIADNKIPENAGWDVEMLAGTVITGSGCSFDVVIPLVFMQHLGRTVDISVEATQTGLCEKAWAQPVWLVVQEVPKDYSANFNLSYGIN